MITATQKIEKKTGESFRDRIATVDEKGKRNWIYAQKPKGKFYQIRTYLSLLYFITFFGLPVARINGRPLFLFNIPQAKFILFLAYIIGVKDLGKIITEPVTDHIVGFSSLLVFSGVFYAVYAFFREQACTAVCPYGRLQGVLLDKNSMVVAYDYKRGEPRGI